MVVIVETNAVVGAVRAGVLSCPMVGTRTSKARVHGCRDGKHKLM